MGEGLILAPGTQVKEGMAASAPPVVAGIEARLVTSW